MRRDARGARGAPSLLRSPYLARTRSHMTITTGTGTSMNLVPVNQLFPRPPGSSTRSARYAAWLEMELPPVCPRLPCSVGVNPK